MQIGTHCVHYRVAGEGAAIVLLHDSPRSSRLHLETMRRLAGRFRVYALDTPGYGNSSPIGVDAPTIADFANLLGKTLAALGLSRAPLYATHTSAKIALDYAASAPDPPAVLLLDGLSIPERAPDEAFIAAYMRPFLLDGDGAYLAAEWSRMQDMLRWFPWFDRRPANRLAMDRPADQWIDDYMLDLLSAGPCYADAYAAAMRYDPAPALRRVSCTTIVGARADDVLFGCLDLLPADKSPSVRCVRLSADRDAWLAWIGDTLAQGAGALDEPPPGSSCDGPVYVDLPHGQMLVHRAGGKAGKPLLVLETPTLLHARIWQTACDNRPTLVPELPGYGESDRLREGALLDDFADALAAMIKALGIDNVDVLAIGLAAPLATALAARHPLLINMLVFDGIASGDGGGEPLCPVIERDHAGGHLHRLWHMLRSGELQYPWFDGRVAAQRRLSPCLDAELLHRALLDILKQPAGYGDVVRAGGNAAVPHRSAVFFEIDGDAGYAGVPAMAVRLGAEIVPRPAEIASAAKVLSDILDRGVCSVADSSVASLLPSEAP